ncbi:MAG: type II toxin-antitoxin system Phd/YefM family antitoxin [Candidatus Saganbacteria bacterium]|nr:type II toxin-antitoxin system Phd/YefM family antitoxin [Candidatus Saganbacteria bacterium]
MRAKTTLSISEARKNIFDIAEQVQKPSTYYTLTENGRPKAVVMSAEEFESWTETLDVIAEFPGLKNSIKEAEKEYKSGDYITLEDLLEKEGYIVRGKKHEVLPRNTKKSPKRNR